MTGKGLLASRFFSEKMPYADPLDFIIGNLEKRLRQKKPSGRGWPLGKKRRDKGLRADPLLPEP
jgi:hypothetical protein